MSSEDLDAQIVADLEGIELGKTNKMLYDTVFQRLKENIEELLETDIDVATKLNRTRRFNAVATPNFRIDFLGYPGDALYSAIEAMVRLLSTETNAHPIDFVQQKRMVSAIRKNYGTRDELPDIMLFGVKENELVAGGYDEMPKVNCGRELQYAFLLKRVSEFEEKYELECGYTDKHKYIVKGRKIELVPTPEELGIASGAEGK